MVGDPGSTGEPPEERHPPNRRPAIIRVLRALKRHENRRRRRTQQEKTDRDLIMARWTRRVGLFTAALVAVGIVTAVIFGWQLTVMQGQLNVMETDKRPWLGVQLSLDKIKLTDWDNSKGINAFLNIDVKNYGGSPAVNTLVIPEIKEHPLYTDKKGMERLDIDQAEIVRTYCHLRNRNSNWWISHISW